VYNELDHNQDSPDRTKLTWRDCLQGLSRAGSSQAGIAPEPASRQR
jgi:hypothetical protein